MSHPGARAQDMSRPGAAAQDVSRQDHSGPLLSFLSFLISEAPQRFSVFYKEAAAKVDCCSWKQLLETRLPTCGHRWGIQSSLEICIPVLFNFRRRDESRLSW